MNLHISYMYKFKGSKCHYKKKILTLVSRIFSMIFFNFSLISYSKNFKLPILIFVDPNNLLYFTIPIVITGSLVDSFIFYINKQYVVEFPSFLDSRYTKRIINQIPHIILNTFIISLLPTLFCLLFIEFKIYQYYIFYMNFFILYSFWNILLEYMKIVVTSISLLKTIDDVIREDNNKINDLNIIIECLYQNVGDNIVDNLNSNSLKNNGNNYNRFNIISDINERRNTVYKDYYNIINNNYKNTLNQLKENNNNNNNNKTIIENYEKNEFSHSLLYKYISNVLINDSSNISQIINSKLWYKLSEEMINNINSLYLKIQICNELMELKIMNNYNNIIPEYILKIPFGIYIFKLLKRNKKIIKDKKLEIITGNSNNNINEWFIYPNIKNEVVSLSINNIEDILNMLLKLIQQNQYDIKGYIQVYIFIIYFILNIDNYSNITRITHFTTN